MKKIDFQHTATLVANVAVIVGIVFLAIELQQNTGELQSQTRASISENTLTYLGWVATSPELARALAKAASDVDSITDFERIQLDYYYAAQIRVWENTHYQFERGLFTEPEYEARKGVWRNRLANADDSELFRAQWESMKERVSPSFRVEVDRIIAQPDVSD